MQNLRTLRFLLKDGTRMFDKNFKENEFLLGTENTAIDMNILSRNSSKVQCLLNLRRPCIICFISIPRAVWTNLVTKKPTYNHNHQPRKKGVIMHVILMYYYHICMRMDVLPQLVAVNFSRGFPNIFVHDSYMVMPHFEKLLYSLGS